MVLLLLLVMGFPLLAEEHVTADADICSLTNYRIDVRPNSDGPPTEVTVGMRIMDITEINDVDQTISVDLAVKLAWTDPRLAPFAGCRLESEDIWFPTLVLRNSGRLFQRWPDSVSVDEGGKAIIIQRISGTFASYVTLREFPFDKQEIDLEFFALEWGLDKLTIKNDEVFSGGSSRMNISDWAVTNVSAHADEVQIHAMQQMHAGLTVTISAKRFLSYYVWKILFPIAMIVIMSWCVFWIEPSEFGTKVGLSATSVLTMIAFIFATTNLLPRLGYFTTLDRYIAGATFLVFLALLQSLSTGFLVSKQRESTAATMDRFSRILFPAVFAAFCVAILSHQL
ncbi:MAG: hypothetical protein R8G34_07370 [Paracoccaceae bacterium]|nr:hypothetical protein [Paracoccaceae bacterium]